TLAGSVIHSARHACPPRRSSDLTVPGLGTSFGRGGATGYLQDLENADCIIIQGSNMAECHPVGFQWVMEAKRKGAKIIHVDPRRSEEHTSELQSRFDLVCRLLLE